MPKPLAEIAEGHEDASGNGVYCFIRDLIVEGRDARFVDKKGRYVINWSRALKCYHDYKSKRNPQYKSKNINRRKASNGLRAALLNFYKKEGAKEYKDCKKVNEKDEVVERQFQMPPRVFETLFGSDVQLSDDSSEPETSSIASEADEKPLATPNSSDTGFDEAMDFCDEPSSEFALDGLPIGDPLCDNVKTEVDQADPSDITTPCQIFDISEEELDSALGEICSNSDNDIDLLGVVRDICPSSGSVKGGLQFYISLTEELSEDDKSGIAHFDGIGDVFLEKLNCYTLAGILPASQQPGPVPVTVNTQDGRLLGMTCFLYVDEIQEVLKQLVNDPALQSLYFAMWSKQHGFLGSDANLAQDLGPFTLQDQGSANQGTHAQALKVLQLLVYTAAQTNAQQFIQMIFSTSAGKLIFNAYKDRPQLPEDVARANGHDDLAQYLQDVNARLSKESGSDDMPNAIDWLELIEAVNKIQKQSSVILDETDLESGQSKDDDNQSDYFADAETSSCGSFELEMEWSGSENGEDERPKKEPDERLTPSMKATSSDAPTVLGPNFDSEVDRKGDGKNDTIVAGDSAVVGKLIFLPKVAASGREEEARTVPRQGKTTKPKRTRKKRRWLKVDDVTTSSHQGARVNETQEVGSFVEGIFQGESGGGTQKRGNVSDRKQEAKRGPSQAKRHHQRSQWGPFRSALLKSFLLLAIAVVTVLCLVAGIKLAERQLLHWAVRSGHIRISQALLKFVSDVDTPNFHGETPLHVAAENGYKDLAELLMKLGSNVNSRDYQQRTPLHLATWSGCQRNMDALIRHGSDVKARDDFQQTALHLAASTGLRNVVQVLIHHGTNVNAGNTFGETPLHLAAYHRRRNIVEVLIQNGSDVDARDTFGEAPLLEAAKSGDQEIIEFLIQHGSEPKTQDDSKQTPLHVAARNGHKNVAEVLIRYGSDVNVRNKFGETPLHLAATEGHLQMVQFLIQRGSDVEARDDEFQLSALHVAAIYGHKQIAELLIHHGTNVNAGNKFGETPLHMAAYNRRRNIVEVLIQNGSDANARDIFGQTPLLMAAGSGDQEMAEFFIQHGSEPKTQEHSKQTPLHLAARNRHRNVAEVLIRYGSDVNVRNKFGETPLHLAVRGGHKQIVEMFLHHGSDVNARDGFQRTPIHLAARNGHKNIAEALIRHGCDVNVSDTFLQTPLHLATQSGRREIVDFLTLLGSGLEVQDDFGAQNGHNSTCINFSCDVILHDDFKQIGASSTLLMAYTSRMAISLNLAVWNGHKKVTEVFMGYGSDVNLTYLHLAAWSGHQEPTEFLLWHESEGQAIDDLLLNTDANFQNNRVQWPASSNAQKMVNITDNSREFDPRNVPVISPDVLSKLLESGRSLEDLLKAEFRSPINQMKFAQTIWEIQSCLAPVNLSIILGNDVSGPRDHKLKLDKPSITQCLSRSLGGGDGISHNMDPGLDIKYHGKCETGYETKRKNLRSLALPSWLLCSTKLATNRKPKDKVVLIKHSFRLVYKSIKNDTSKMLKRSKIPLKEIAYEGHHLVNAMLPLLLMTLVILYTVPRKGLWYRSGNSGATASETNGSQRGRITDHKTEFQ